jgi:hypothetical protein
MERSIDVHALSMMFDRDMTSRVLTRVLASSAGYLCELPLMCRRQVRVGVAVAVVQDRSSQP